MRRDSTLSAFFKVVVYFLPRKGWLLDERNLRHIRIRRSS